jgi:hypothetical protein
MAVENSFFRDDMIHADISGIVGHAGDLLAGERKADFREMGIPGEEPVVITGPVPEPVTPAVECQDRNNNCPDILRQSRYFVADRFRDTERALYQVNPVSEIGKPQAPGIFLDYGNNNPCAAGKKVIEKGMSVHLEWFGYIDHDRIHAVKKADQVTAYLPAHIFNLGLAERGAYLPGRIAQGCFGWNCPGVRHGSDVLRLFPSSHNAGDKNSVRQKKERKNQNLK